MISANNSNNTHSNGALSGKNAVITGARRGIGRATVEAFAQSKANIWACARKPNEAFEQDMAQLAQKYGVTIKPVYFELTNEEQIKAAVKAIKDDKKNVDVLVNAAGITHSALFHMTSLKAFREIFEVDLFAQILLSQLITKLMLKAGQGSVVNVASYMGIEGHYGQIAYSSVKAAFAAASITMSRELAPRGIRVNAIAPGPIDTEMTKSLTDSQRQDLINPSDIKRLGTPSEIAETIAFLASDKASFITGQIIRVDGGRS